MAAPQRFSRRVSLDLEPADYEQLRREAFEEGVPMTRILRGLLAVYGEDQAVKDKAIEWAKQERDGGR